MFEVDVDKIAFIIAKSREFEAQDAVHEEVEVEGLTENDIQDESFQESLSVVADEENDDATFDEVKATNHIGTAFTTEEESHEEISKD